MPRINRLTQFLHKRRTRWYFRFRFPAAIRRMGAAAELRLSLGTTDRLIACERARGLSPHVYAIKRLSRTMAALTREDVHRALREAVQRLVDDLERAKQPWFSHDALRVIEGFSIRANTHGINSNLIDTLQKQNAIANISRAQRDLQAKNYSRVVGEATQVLAFVGVTSPDPSTELDELCEELLKLEALRWQVDFDRRSGQLDTERSYLESYTRRGLLGSSAARPAVFEGKQAAKSASPMLSLAWNEYVHEKTAVHGAASWNAKTAAAQQATFTELLEIIGDQPVGALTRAAISGYLQAASKLPANRRKKYPDRTIADLLANPPAGAKPLSSRSISERFVQVTSFLKWCREVKDYLKADPTLGLAVTASSTSYAQFRPEDLVALFRSDAYLNGRHRKSWQFWLPLIGLYSGARLGEIAQLTTGNIVQEDGVWLLVVTDAGKGQKVKTKAAVRKVPLSERLIELGLVQYAQALIDRGEQRLFPDLPGSRVRDRLSRWFNEEYKRDCGIKDDPTGARKVFHSFRHTAITKAVTAGLPLAHCQQVFGHERSVLGETSTYLHEIAPVTLRPVVAALEFGLDHSAYRTAWRIYAEP
jgi:integrase